MFLILKRLNQKYIILLDFVFIILKKTYFQACPSMGRQRRNIRAASEADETNKILTYGPAHVLAQFDVAACAKVI